MTSCTHAHTTTVRASIALAAAAAVLALPSAAFASTAAVDGTTLSFTAAPGELNKVQVVRNANTFRVQDSAGILPGARCTRVSDVEVSCPRPTIIALRATAADGDDDVTSDIDVAATLLGDAGDDKLTGGVASDAIQGGQGEDALDGRAGNDAIDGGAGPDKLSGGDGDDTLGARDGEVDDVDCGNGTDTAIVDARDVVTGCETVDRPVAPAASPAAVTPTSAPLARAPVAGARPAPLVMLSPFPMVRIRGLLEGRGVRLQLLSVRTPAGATAQVRCIGSACRRLARSARSMAVVARSARTVSFRRLRGPLAAGTVIEVRVTRPDRIGKFTRFRIRAGKAPARIDRCLRPGRAAPVACPS